MQVIKHTLSFGSKKIAEVAYAMCWHIGNPSHDKQGTRKFLEFAKKRAWWDGGDTIEAIGPHDKRFQHSEHKMAMTNQMSEASDLIADARDTCWGKICGNHEYGGSSDVGDIAEHIASMARVPYLGACCYFDVKCPNGRALIFAAHGSGSLGFNSGVPERDDLNRRLKLRRILSGFDGDAVDECGSFAKCVGHFHRTVVDPARDKYNGTVEKGQFKRRAVPLRESWVMAAPSMFRNYESGGAPNYAEMKLYAPTDIGWLSIVYNRNGTIACVREYNNDGQVAKEYCEDSLR